MHNFLQYRTLINQWIQDYKSFYDILLREKESLENHDFDALSQATKDKYEIIQEINQHNPPHIDDVNFVHSTPMVSFKNFCQANPELTEPWETLTQLAEACLYKNEVNAELVQLLSESSERIYNLIKGFDPDNHIYNSKGSSTRIQHSAEPIRA